MREGRTHSQAPSSSAYEASSPVVLSAACLALVIPAYPYAVPAYTLERSGVSLKLTILRNDWAPSGPLDQRHLDLLLLARRGGEAEPRDVLSS
jgi:hypothetical protein